MKKLILIALFVLAGVSATYAQDHVTTIPNETLNYDVSYRWGFINKVAGYATMTCKSDGDVYKAALYARNAPWADSFYMLRDTLYTTMSKKGLKPIEYTYIAHEDGKYKKDIVRFSHIGDVYTGNCTRYKLSNSGALTSTTIQLKATGMTVDMLSSFYYLRLLDFPKMKIGTKNTVNIFSGTKKEKLTITYKGKKRIEIDDKFYDSYYVTFTYTHNGKVSSDPIEGWISADGRRVPLKVEGVLPVGKVTATLNE